MKKKRYQAAALSLSVLLSGCAGKHEEQVVYLPDETVTETEAAVRELSTEETQVENEEDKTETEEYNTSGGEELSEDAYGVLRDFAYSLFGENMAEENPVLSPVSAYIALSMAGLGAENNTGEEFEAVLGAYPDMTALCDDLMNTLSVSSESNKVTLACSAWIDDEMNVYDSWLADIDTIMHSEAFRVNLSDTETVTQMNDWIEDKTNGLIGQMVDEPFDKDARLVLFNTVYFKAKWASMFDAADTYEDKFYTEDGSALDTEMMHKHEAGMDYVANDFVEGLIFPYQNWDDGDGNFELVALKPVDEEAKVRDIYSELTGEVIADLLSNKQTEMVNTKLPKFELEFAGDLNESLISMGLVDAFKEDAADFGGIGVTDTGDGIYIDLVSQKVKITVDEEGTEAAAATSILMARASSLMTEEPMEIYFDSPFIYIIMDMDKEIPLFIGILDNPTVS